MVRQLLERIGLHIEDNLPRQVSDISHFLS